MFKKIIFGSNFVQKYPSKKRRGEKMMWCSTNEQKKLFSTQSRIGSKTVNIDLLFFVYFFLIFTFSFLEKYQIYLGKQKNVIFWFGTSLGDYHFGRYFVCNFWHLCRSGLLHRLEKENSKKAKKYFAKSVIEFRQFLNKINCKLPFLLPKKCSLKNSSRSSMT